MKQVSSSGYRATQCIKARASSYIINEECDTGIKASAHLMQNCHIEAVHMETILPVVSAGIQTLRMRHFSQCLKPGCLSSVPHTDKHILPQ